MRKVIGLFATGLLAVSLAACGTAGNQEQTAAPSAPATSDAPAEQKTLKLGITQFVEHPALDSVYKGIVDGLAASGYEDGKQIAIDFQNAHGEIANTTTIAQKFAGDKDDMVIAIATPSAQAVAKTVQDVPIVFSTVTDPISAELVSSLEKPDKNITGTSDKLSMAQQLELIQKFLPNLKKLGVLYTTSEVNSGVQVKELQEAGKQKGIEVVEAGISSLSEIQNATQSLVGNVDAVLIPIDNTIVSGFEGVLSVAEKAKLPVFASDTDTVKRGAVATFGIDYYKMGKQTGEMAARILGGQQVADTPVEVSKETDLYINAKAAETFGLQVPEDLAKSAKEVFQ
ncbi:ABC transporter substrate binding protein [Brevibacillus fulvus]|uniref:ABC transport system substrate-binding protein n=1 Tax=Brevibacillus fulvus TaxID=1125967 RepID=A0A938Y3U5_9BACL|nr:ABC transporter substrate binding protein [Brevibacillus fulvus]MBM7591102.1 putative ABC transport system substrate-binding protein [Brevibacillus fulvus]